MERPGVNVPSPPLHSGQRQFFARMAAALPRRWLATPRRRRLLFLALAAPGFFTVFATPLHRNLFLALTGFPLFAAAVVFRLRTEPLFAEQVPAGPRPDPEPSTANLKETPCA
jgi:hypothetical protein